MPGIPGIPGGAPTSLSTRMLAEPEIEAGPTYLAQVELRLLEGRHCSRRTVEDRHTGYLDSIVRTCFGQAQEKTLTYHLHTGCTPSLAGAARWLRRSPSIFNVVLEDPRVGE